MPKTQYLKYNETDSEDEHKCIYWEDYVSTTVRKGSIQWHKCRKQAHDASTGLNKNDDVV